MKINNSISMNMPCTPRLLPSLLAFAILVICPSAVFAIPFYVQADGYTNAFTGVQNNWAWVSGVPNTSTGQRAQTSYPFSIASTADGNLSSVTATQSGSVSPGSISFSSNVISSGQVAGGGVSGATGTVSTILGWGDTILLQSSTLPNDTAVDIQFTLSLAGSLGVVGDTNTTYDKATITASLSATLLGAAPVVVQGGILGTGLWGSTPNFPAGTYVITGTGLIGHAYTFHSELESVVKATNTFNVPVESFVNANSNVWIQSLTPGVSLVSASGTNYSVVPLPAAVWLFGSGLLGMVGIARRKKAV